MFRLGPSKSVSCGDHHCGEDLVRLELCQENELIVTKYGILDAFIAIATDCEQLVSGDVISFLEVFLALTSFERLTSDRVAHLIKPKL